MNHILNGVFIRGPFKHDGGSYPANWCQLVTAEERAAIGVIDVPVPALPEDYSADVYEYVEDATQAPYAWYQRRSDEQIEAIAKQRAVDRIAALETSALLPRPSRDFMLAMMVQLAAQQGVSEPDLYARNPGYRKVKDLDEEIKALRESL